MKLPEGMIKVDSEFGKFLGFTSDKFEEGSYLWGEPKNNLIYISFIWALKKGAFRNLMQKIEKLGLIFKIPTPLERMLEIGIKQGWRKTEEIHNGDCYTILTNK